MTNQHRDSYASFIGHAPLLNYFSIAENECSARVKFNLMEVRMTLFILLKEVSSLSIL